MTVQAILLDLDNTLYEYDPCNERALAAVYQRLTQTARLEADEFHKLHDAAREELAARLPRQAASHSRLLLFRTILARVDRPKAWELALDLHELYWHTFYRHMESAPGLHETLAALAQRAPLALVTNQTTEVQLRKVARLGIASYLTEIVTSEEAGADKPDRHIFQLTLDRLRVHRPAEAVMVGDTSGDIHGAQDYGLRSVQSIQFTRDPPLGADRIIRDVRELVDMMDEW